MRGEQLAKKNIAVAAKQIEQRIFVIRGQKVILDRDLTELYEVETKQLKRAVRVNIEIMRAFFRLRQMLDAHKHLRCKLAALEKKYDDQFKMVFEAIAELITPPEKARRIYPDKLGLAMCF